MLRTSVPLLFSMFATVMHVACTTGTACTEEARQSLSVTVTDDAGAAVVDAAVTATHGGDIKTCESLDDGSYFCDFSEVAGDFVITATKDGFVDTSESVTVDADACHVITESVTLVLVVANPPCCCAYIKPGDIDIISEEPTETTSACLARDQGACIDPTGRFTPHPCCPDATGDRCE
jgi:hypothetical protein